MPQTTPQRTLPMPYSPSTAHRRVLDQLTPALAYEGGDWEHWRESLRAKLRELVGLGQMPATRCPLSVKVLWRRDHDLGVIEKVVFTAEPGADTPAYVCLPREAEPPYTFAICLQGHSTGMHNSIAVDRDDERTATTPAGDRDFAIGCMRRGLAALCIEQRSFGERREQVQDKRSPNGCHDAAMAALMLGRTLLGERIYDIDRGIDYLAQRGDADMQRVLVTGNSGGGTASIYAAALLDRVGFAMPSASFCGFGESILAMEHCVCNYIPGLSRWADMGDVLGLMAPRPVVAVVGREDPIFPLAGAERAFAQLQRVYRAAGAEGRCHLVVGDGGHRFYADDAWPVMLGELASPLP